MNVRYATENRISLASIRTLISFIGETRPLSIKRLSPPSPSACVRYSMKG